MGQHRVGFSRERGTVSSVRCSQEAAVTTAMPPEFRRGQATSDTQRHCHNQSSAEPFEHDPPIWWAGCSQI